MGVHLEAETVYFHVIIVFQKNASKMCAVQKAYGKRVFFFSFGHHHKNGGGGGGWVNCGVFFEKKKTGWGWGGFFFLKKKPGCGYGGERGRLKKIQSEGSGVGFS